MMSSETINLNTRAHSYDPPLEKKLDEVSSDKPSTSTPPPSNGIHIEKPIPEEMFLPPKSTLRKSVINPNACSSQYYKIVEDLAQAPFTMSALEVLQTCPTQRKNLLTALGSMDPKNSNVIAFKLYDFKSSLSHQLALKLSTKSIGKKVHISILDEGALTLVMSLSYWRAIGSPEINRSSTTLKVFDARSF